MNVGSTVSEPLCPRSGGLAGQATGLGAIRVVAVPRADHNLLEFPGSLAPAAATARVVFVGFGRQALRTAANVLSQGAAVAWVGAEAIESDSSDRDLGLAGRSWAAWPGDGPAFTLSDARSALRAADVIVVGTARPDDPPARRLAALGRTCALIVSAVKRDQTIVITDAAYVGCTKDLLVTPLEERGLLVGTDVQLTLSPEWCGQGSNRDPAALSRFVEEVTRASTATPLSASRRGVSPADCFDAVEFEMLGAPAKRLLQARLKRALDVVVAATALLLLSPLLALIALAILLDDRRPVLFVQLRAGQGGRLFAFRKFRTMVDGAEGRLNEVLGLNQIQGPGFQIDHDPRLTRIGGFLRRTSLDELPQLWNVLVGEMSLVGPRPAPMCEVLAYEGWHRRRLSVKPGITGLAQVRARRYRQFDEKAYLDAEYIERWSLRLDLSILFWTIPTVLRLTGR